MGPRPASIACKSAVLVSIVDPAHVLLNARIIDIGPAGQLTPYTRRGLLKTVCIGSHTGAVAMTTLVWIIESSTARYAVGGVGVSCVQSELVEACGPRCIAIGEKHTSRAG